MANDFARGVEYVQGDFGSVRFVCIRGLLCVIRFFRRRGTSGIGAFFLCFSFLQRCLQPVINDGACRRILATVQAGTKERTIEQSVAGDSGREEVSVLLRNGIAVLAQGGDVVEHPEAAAMRGYDEVVIFYHEIVHWGDGQIELERLPLSAVIVGNKDAGFGPSKEQAGALGIDAHGMDVAVCGKTVHELGPGLAEVAGLENVGREVVELVTFEGDVCGPSFRWGGFNHANRAPFGHGSGCDVFPMLSSIARYVHEAIIRASPDQIFLRRRFHDGKNRVVNFDAGICLW